MNDQQGLGIARGAWPISGRRAPDPTAASRIAGVEYMVKRLLAYLNARGR